jgi:hypothetical protein
MRSESELEILQTLPRFGKRALSPGCVSLLKLQHAVFRRRLALGDQAPPSLWHALNTVRERISRNLTAASINLSKS